VKRKIKDYVNQLRRDNDTVALPFNTEARIYTALFRNRTLVCEETGMPVTEECFLDHHTLELGAIEGNLDVKCDKCKLVEVT
jgi:hypothetical protein